jgi:hypothetical protein
MFSHLANNSFTIDHTSINVAAKIFQGRGAMTGLMYGVVIPSREQAVCTFLLK